MKYWYEDNVTENKYGVTPRQEVIFMLVEEGLPLESLPFEATEEDRKFYEEYAKEVEEKTKANSGVRPVIVHYIDD